MGNLLTTSMGLAQFYADLYGGKLLAAASIKEMTTFHKLTIGTEPPAGTPYGLGQMVVTIPVDAFQKGDPRTLLFVGHGGEDWGSGFPSANWVPGLNLSLAIGINNGESPVGMNTSLTWAQNAHLVGAAYCLAGDILYRYRGQPGIKCFQHGSFDHAALANVNIPRAHK